MHIAPYSPEIHSDDTLTGHAAEIRRLGKRVVADVIEIGRRLDECKGICGHGNWLSWLKREFGWSVSTAENYINLHKLSAKFPTVGNLDFDMRSLYLLAAPSTPDEARDEIIERAQAGERVPIAEAKRVIDKGGRFRKPRDCKPGRADIHRRMKLGDATVDMLKGTSLDNAREVDELVFLNRGAPEGGHTEIVQHLVAEAVAGKDVSAITTAKDGVPPPGEIARILAENTRLRRENDALRRKVAELESELLKIPLFLDRTRERCSACGQPLRRTSATT